MKREQRLRRARDFAAVHARGRGPSNVLLAVRALATAGDTSRVGFAVGKRVGNAVVRNRVKRRLREAVRTMALPSGWDLILIARPAAAHADFARLAGAARSLLGRAGVVDSAGGRASRERASIPTEGALP